MGLCWATNRAGEGAEAGALPESRESCSAAGTVRSRLPAAAEPPRRVGEGRPHGAEAAQEPAAAGWAARGAAAAAAVGPSGHRATGCCPAVEAVVHQNWVGRADAAADRFPNLEVQKAGAGRHD